MSVNLSREEFAKEFGRRTIENLKTMMEIMNKHN